MKTRFINILLSFLKMGTISFGGGASLIPVIENELLVKNKLISKKDFDTAVAVASISPASLSIAFCSVWNRKYAILSSYSYALPGALIYLVLLTGSSLIGDAGMRYLEYASVGLIIFVLFLLCRFIKRNYLNGVKSGIKKQYLIVIALSFFLTCGNVLRRLFVELFQFPADRWPEFVFSITMVNLVLTTFFIIIFLGESKSKIKFCVTIILASIYILSLGNIGFLIEWSLQIGVTLTVLAVVSVFYDTLLKKNGKAKQKKFKIDYQLIKNLALFILICAIFVSAMYIISGNFEVLEFSYRAITSSLTSFGGGEVFYGISEAAFVQTGLISEEFFNTHILGVAGAMPGSVLASILTGIGYAQGIRLGGVVFGWLFGLLGLSLGITATAIGALSLFILIDLSKDSYRLRMIIRYIIPVVCGMLASTAFSMLRQSSLVLIREGIHPFFSIAICIVIVVGLLLTSKKYRVNDITLLLFCSLGAVSILSVINYLR